MDSKAQMNVADLTYWIESCVEVVDPEVRPGQFAPTGEAYLEFANGFLVAELERVPLIATSAAAAIECFRIQFLNYLDRLNRRYERILMVQGTLFWREKPTMTKFSLRQPEHPADIPSADYYIVHATLLISGNPGTRGIL